MKSQREMPFQGCEIVFPSAGSEVRELLSKNPFPDSHLDTKPPKYRWERVRRGSVGICGREMAFTPLLRPPGSAPGEEHFPVSCWLQREVHQADSGKCDLLLGEGPVREMPSKTVSNACAPGSAPLSGFEFVAPGNAKAIPEGPAKIFIRIAIIRTMWADSSSPLRSPQNTQGCPTPPHTHATRRKVHRTSLAGAH